MDSDTLNGYLWISFVSLADFGFHSPKLARSQKTKYYAIWWKHPINFFLLTYERWQGGHTTATATQDRSQDFHKEGPRRTIWANRRAQLPINLLKLLSHFSLMGSASSLSMLLIYWTCVFFTKTPSIAFEICFQVRNLGMPSQRGL